jgi:hypothetical protein
MTARALTVAALATAGLGLAGVQAPAAHSAQQLDVSGNVRLLPGGGATLRQRGSFSGVPLGSGTLNVTTDVGRGRGALVRFVMTNRRGSISGTGDVRVTFRGSQVIYDGSARITGGTGAFQRIRGTGLRVSGRGDLSGSRFAVHLAGRIAG